VFEAEHGEVVRVRPIRRRVPVEEYLRLQGRYKHLFEPVHRADVLAAVAAIAQHNIDRYGLLDPAGAKP